MRKKLSQLVRSNLRLAQVSWTELSQGRLSELKDLTLRYSVSVAIGDIQLLDQRWYVTHAGLLRLAERRRCLGIQVQQVYRFCDPVLGRWVFKAIVHKSATSKGFVGYGDADPSNVSSLVRGAEMRVAETRAVNRALRKAYGIGLCSVEELGWLTSRSGSDLSNQNLSPANGNNGHQSSQPRLRDRLCLLIRQHQLDAGHVKAYAAEYCGTAALREASRSQIESFINHMAEWAAKDRDALLCKLNSYSQTHGIGA